MNSPSDNRSDGPVAGKTDVAQSGAAVAAPQPGEVRDATKPVTSDDRTVAVTIQDEASAVAAEEAKVGAEWKVGDVILGLYEVKQVLGGGGMGLVYRIHHRGWGVDMAVKSPRADSFKTSAQKKLFSDECETWIKLGQHPNVVTCHYVRTLGGIPRVFAEYVEGGNLKDWIDGNGKDAESRRLYQGEPQEVLKRILDVAIQVAEGLAYAHQQGFVHQDIKPSNVMLTQEGIAKLTDFGLVKATGGMTPAYCSPEQAKLDALWKAGENPATLPKLTWQSDLWSWAVSLLEMFAGGLSWKSGLAAPDILSDLLEKGPDDLAIPKIPEKVSELLAQCLSKAPESRPNGMAAIAASLKEAYRELFAEAYPRPTPQPVEFRGGGGLNNRAIVLMDLGKFDEAEQMLRQALEQSPCHPVATYNLWTHLWRKGRATDEQVVTQIKAATRVHPEDRHAAYLLGLVHMQRGDPDSAVDVLKAAVDLDPGKVDESLKALLSAAQTLASTQWQELRVPSEPPRERFAPCAMRLGKTELFAGSGRRPCPVAFAVTSIAVQSEPPTESAPQHRCSSESSPLAPVQSQPAVELPLRGIEARAEAAMSARRPAATSVGWGQTGTPYGYAIYERCLQFIRSLGGRRFSNAAEIGDVIREAKCLRQQLHSASGFPLVLSGEWQTHCASLLSLLAEVESRASGLKNQLDAHDVPEKCVRFLRSLETGCIKASELGGISATAMRLAKELRALLGCSFGQSAEWQKHCTSMLSLLTEVESRVWSHFSRADLCITALAAIPRAAMVLTGHLDGTVAAWREPYGKNWKPPGYEPCSAHWWFAGRGSAITHLSVDSSGKNALSATENGILQLWDVVEAKKIGEWQYQEGISSAVIVPSGMQALLAGRNGSLQELDLKTGNFVRGVEKGSVIRCIALTGSGEKCVTGDDSGVVKVWDLAKGQCIQQLRAHEQGVLHVGVTQDGRWLWSAGRDGRLQLWQAETGICMRTDRLDAEPASFSLSSKGHEVVVALQDKYVLRHVHYPPEWLCLPCPVRLLSPSDALAARAKHEALLVKAENALAGKRFAEAVHLCEQATQVETLASTPESRGLWSKLSRSCARVGIRNVRPARILSSPLKKSEQRLNKRAGGTSERAWRLDDAKKSNRSCSSRPPNWLKVPGILSTPS